MHFFPLLIYSVTVGESSTVFFTAVTVAAILTGPKETPAYAGAFVFLMFLRT